VDDLLEKLEREDEQEFDWKLVHALLKRAGEVGELRLSAEDAWWFLRVIGTDSWWWRHDGQWPSSVITPKGPVPLIVE
jgi:hypothetical protein